MYHRKYRQVTKPPNNGHYWINTKGKYIVARKKEILVRFQYLTRTPNNTKICNMPNHSEY